MFFDHLSRANEITLELQSASIIQSNAPKLCMTQSIQVIELLDVFITGSIWQVDDREDVRWNLDSKPNFCLLNLDTKAFIIKGNLNPAQRFRYIFQGIQPWFYNSEACVFIKDIKIFVLFILLSCGVVWATRTSWKLHIRSNLTLPQGWNIPPKTNLHMQYFLLTLLAILTRTWWHSVESLTDKQGCNDNHLAQ